MAASAADLLAAINADDAARVRALLAADPALAEARDDAGVSLLLQAVYRGKPAALAELRAARAGYDVYEAAALGDLESLTATLLQPAAVASHAADGFTPLHLAAFFGHEQAAAMLLSAGAEANAIAQNGSRVQPLHSAAAGRHVAVCALLLDHGAAVDARQHGGFTPLHAAAQHGDTALVQLLLEHGANPALATDDGRTARDYAADDAAVLALLDGAARPV
jgi:adenosylhomocysteine nucleosidase